MYKFIFLLLGGFLFILARAGPELASLGTRGVSDAATTISRGSSDAATVANRGANAFDEATATRLDLPSSNLEETLLLSERSDLFARVAEEGTRALSDFRELSEGTHSILVSAPRTEETFAAIFGKSPKARDLSDVTTGIEKILSIATDATPREIESSEDLIRHIQTTDNNFITIVGHNEDGYLRMPDGSSVKIEELSNYCMDSRRKCIFLSCNSAEYVPPSSASASGINTDISYYDAALVLEALTKKISGRKQSSYMMMDAFLRHEAASQARLASASRRISKIASPIVVGGGGIGMVTYGVDSDRE